MGTAHPFPVFIVSTCESSIDNYSLIDYINAVKKAYSLTEAKTRFSEIISRLIHEKDVVVITKKRENVAVLVPFDRYNELSRDAEAGLICARGALSGLDDEIEKMTQMLEAGRKKERSRKVDL
jgi:prevent-host-death family protein